MFEITFLDMFFPYKMGKAKVEELMNHNQGSMLVKEYSLMLIKLSKYTLEMVGDPRARMSKFITGMSESVIKEFRMTILIRDMDIFQLMTNDGQIKIEKLK